VVIKGNHDPDSPPRIVFPRSKALYVRASSTLVVNGVTFAIEPYARRMSLRSIRNQLSHSESPLPFCDVLVTHEPPKGVLDLTYHGFTAGSQFLRNLADNAKHKPRLWLCGHIHEGRGILTKTFSSNADEESDESKSTIVINAANANSGKANRLVSGAVLIDIERSHIDESQTAQNTIQLRQTEENDEVAPENMAGLENMTEYVTRPGVRRRKGIPRRQLIK
jgi:Icc-related predicted phosphoesterase